MGSRKGILCKTGGSTKYLCCIFNNDDCIVGAADGSL